MVSKNSRIKYWFCCTYFTKCQKDQEDGSSKTILKRNSDHQEHEKTMEIGRLQANVPITQQVCATQSPYKSTDSNKRPPSLENIGANCYLNSALQGISSCDKFVTDISTEYDNNIGLKKLEIFFKLLFILNGGKVNRLEMSRNPIFREWNKPGQQDSFELLVYILNQVYNEIRKHKENVGQIPKRDMEEWLKIQLPMRIMIEYTIKCGCNNEVNVPLQSDLALHVSIPSTGKNELQTLVDRFFLWDEIEDYRCNKDGCSGEKAIRYTKLRKPLPRTICIHLQRTFWNGKKMVKINTMIPFTKTLKIQNQFCSLKNIELKETNKKSVVKILNASENNRTEVKDSIIVVDTVNNNSVDLEVNGDTFSNSDDEHCDKNKNKNDEDKSEEIFLLTSVIVHYGSADGGHYVCYKRLNDKWFLTNDSIITEVSEKAVFLSKAYVLFYEKP